MAAAAPAAAGGGGGGGLGLGGGGGGEGGGGGSGGADDGAGHVIPGDGVQPGDLAVLAAPQSVWSADQRVDQRRQ